MLSALIGGALIGLAATLFRSQRTRRGGERNAERRAPGVGPARGAARLPRRSRGRGSALPGFPRAAGPGAISRSASLLVAGVLVGFGTRLGGGCTSGHGVCGLSRFSSPLAGGDPDLHGRGRRDRLRARPPPSGVEGSMRRARDRVRRRIAVRDRPLPLGDDRSPQDGRVPRRLWTLEPEPRGGDGGRDRRPRVAAAAAPRRDDGAATRAASGGPRRDRWQARALARRHLRRRLGARRATARAPRSCRSGSGRRRRSGSWAR